MLLGVVVYIVMKPLLKSFFSVRSRYEDYKPVWKLLMTLYNVAMCVYSLLTFVFGCHALSHGAGLFTMDPAETFHTGSYAFIAKIFWLSKYVEYLDTIFLIVAGKDVSFLQYCKLTATLCC